MDAFPVSFVINVTFKQLIYWINLMNLLLWLNTMTGDETGLTSQLISTPSLPTQPMKGCTIRYWGLKLFTPTLYEQQCGLLYVPQESEQWKSCETGPTVFFFNKGSTFSLVIFRLWVFELERLPFVWKTRKFLGEFKWSGSSRWKFSGKKVIPFEVLPFSRFYRNDRNFLYHLIGLLGFVSRESEKLTGIL